MGKKSEAKAIVLFIIILFYIFLPLPSWAQGMPSLEMIINKVLEATDPFVGYQVDVFQTASSTSSGQQQPVSTAFTIFYDPPKGFSSKWKYGAQADSESGAMKTSNPRLRLNIPRFLNDVSTWSNVQIVSDQLEGRNCYKISGWSPDKKFSYSLWVDSQYGYVPKVVATKGGLPFETTIEYRLVNGQYWLPSRIFMTNDSEGVVILQEFGQYEMNLK
jgi:hypothetical protein